MTLKECYDAMGGDYEEVLGRLRSETLVQKFLLKFPADPSFDELCHAVETKDREHAFRAAHTMKGVCSNLGFSKLYRSSAELTEALRSEWKPEAEALVKQVTEDYQTVIAAIKLFQGAVGR